MALPIDAFYIASYAIDVPSLNSHRWFAQMRLSLGCAAGGPMLQS